MPIRFAYTLLAICALLALYAAPARAQCGGLCLYEMGTPDNGRSAAGASARAEDATTVLWNPAGMTRLEGVHMHLGTVLGITDMAFDVGPGTTSTGNNGGDLNTFLPLAGAFVALNPIEKLRMGIAFTASYGGAVDYDNDWVGRSFVTEAKLMGMNFALQFAYPVTDWLSVGAGINFMYALFDMKLRTSNDNGAPTLEISNADDWAPSANVGLLFTPREDTRIGINYRSQTSLNLSGDFDLPVGVPGLDDLDIGVEMNFPQGFNVGVFHQLTEKIDLFADAGWSQWSKFGYMPMTIRDASIPVDRDWDDTWRLAAGARFRPLPKWMLNTGFSWDSSPVSKSKRLPDIPAGGQFRFSLGSEHPVAKNITLGIAYTFVYSPSMEVDNVPLPPSGSTILDGDYDPTFLHFVTLNVSFRFGGPDA
jgi:long-chain fatty acid transport protein